MKIHYFLLFTLCSLTSFSQTNDSVAITNIQQFQNELNTHYKDKQHSPLTKKDRRKFKGHDFYKIDLKYRVTGTIELTPQSDTFAMKTTTSRKPLYRQYGIVKFSIDGVDYQLSVYQNIKFSQIEEYKNSLFLLYNDDTNGSETYNGGRYIDLEKPSGNKIIIDFNLSYNPYCHYNSKYSCPIPPSENYLPIEIKAGIKANKDAKKH